MSRAAATRLAVAAILAAALCAGCGPRLVSSGTQRVAAQPATRPAGPASLADRIAPLAEAVAKQAGADRALAVLPFAQRDGGITAVGIRVRHALVAALLARGVRVVDRKHLADVVAERRLAMAGDPHGRPVAQADRIAGADALVYGTLIAETGGVRMLAEVVSVETGTLLAPGPSIFLPDEAVGTDRWYVHRPPSPGAAPATRLLPPLTLSYRLVRTEDGRERTIPDGGTVRSGQSFKLVVEPNSDCYLYVLHSDGSGSVTPLVPPAGAAARRSLGMVAWELPAGDRWFVTDDTPGTETLYVVASYVPLTNLEGLCRRLRARPGAVTARQIRKQIQDKIAPGMTPAGADRYRPEGFTIAPGTTGQSGPSGQVRVVGRATVVERIRLHHR